MDVVEEDAYLDEIASRLIHILPGLWELAIFDYRAAGTSFEEASLSGGLADPRELHKHNETTPAWLNDAEKSLPLSGIYPLVRELRSRMYKEGDGTWMQMRLRVHCRAGRTSLPDGDTPLWDVRYHSVDEISWAQRIPPAAAAEELRRFPQDPQRVPEWMARLAALQESVDRFDAERFMRLPHRQSALEAALPPEQKSLFAEVRTRLMGFLPNGSADRFLLGRLADGCWSVIHSAPAWLAVRMENGTCVEKHAFADAADAVAFAAGAVIAEAGAEVNSAILRGAGVLTTESSPRKKIDAWMIHGHGNPASIHHHLSRSAERPNGAAARRRRYISLEQLHNSPGGYFIAHPGPVPAKGDFLSTHQIFEWYVRDGLPQAKPPSLPPPEDVNLEPGLELDAYDGDSMSIACTVGTPFERRRLIGYPEDYTYRVYRVVRPLRATPITLDAKTVYRRGERGPKRLPAHRGRIFSLPRSIWHHLESGDLVELNGPGGEPIPLRDYWDMEEES